MTTLITLIVVDTFTKGLAISVAIVFVILFFILLYQLSKAEYEATRYKKDFCESFAENIKLKSENARLSEYLNDCQVKIIDSNSFIIELCNKIDELNKR